MRPVDYTDNMDSRSPKVGIAVFIWRGDKFIIQQRLGSHGSGTWSVPGGHLELNESWEDCARRETLEETGVEITNIRSLAVTNDIFKDEGKHYITIWMEADWLAKEPSIKEPDKLTDIKWATFHDLPKPLFEPCWKNLRQTKPKLFE